MSGLMARERTGGSTATRFAAQVVRGWVGFYTGWVSASAAERRREEIDSDLWEQQAYARETRMPHAAVSLSIMRRAAVGIPADLLWVHRERAAMRSQPAQQKAPMIMNSALRLAGAWWWALGAAVLSALILTMGIGQLLQPGMPYLAGSIHAIAAGIALAAGVVLKARMPRTAAALVVLGTATPSVLWWAPLIMVLGIAVLLGSAIDLIRRLAERDVVRGALTAAGIIAMNGGIIVYAFVANEAGPAGLAWLLSTVVGIGILIAIGNASRRPTMRTAALA